MLEWANDTLFPEARADERIVVCLRSAGPVGAKKGHAVRQSLYAPETNRKGFMHHGPVREEIVKAVRPRVFGLWRPHAA